MSARPLFIGGTSSNAGKSWMTTAICAFLRGRGVKVAPFKAQNMSNHSYPCRRGGEIGRAQVAQAEACGLEPEPAMNPILLKPNGNGTSQVVLHGKVWKTLSARDYYAEHDMLMREVLRAYHDLASRFEVVVIEGAGSVSEINLRQVDLVNLALVSRLEAPWVLVADIERGGVIAAIAGTHLLLTDDERRLFRGFLINKFHGDRALFDEGRLWLETWTGVPCLGVFPYADDLRLDAEDSLSLISRRPASTPPGPKTAIVRLPHLSNGTDFRLLSWADWITAPAGEQYEFIILPGTKDTLGDLAWLRERGFDRWIAAQHAAGATVIGICGGYQMLGTSISDPAARESTGGHLPGLGLLPASTVMAAEKVTAMRAGRMPSGATFSAYEIHLGVTMLHAPLPPFALLVDGTHDGVRGDRVIGTYLHGVFESPEVCADLFGTVVESGLSRAEEYVALGQWFGRYAERVEDWLALG